MAMETSPQALRIFRSLHLVLPTWTDIAAQPAASKRHGAVSKDTVSCRDVNEIGRISARRVHSPLVTRNRSRWRKR
jgi:hypothetical protein